MQRLPFGWLAAVVIVAAAATVIFLRRPSKARRDINGRALGWDTAEGVKQAASPVIAHEPGVLR